MRAPTGRLPATAAANDSFGTSEVPNESFATSAGGRHRGRSAGAAALSRPAHRRPAHRRRLPGRPNDVNDSFMSPDDMNKSFKASGRPHSTNPCFPRTTHVE